MQVFLCIQCRGVPTYIICRSNIKLNTNNINEKYEQTLSLYINNKQCNNGTNNSITKYDTKSYYFYESLKYQLSYR